MRDSATTSTIGATELPNHRLEPSASSVADLSILREAQRGMGIVAR